MANNFRVIKIQLAQVKERLTRKKIIKKMEEITIKIQPEWPLIDRMIIILKIAGSRPQA